MAIKHAFTSAKSDPADTTLIKPSNWNADHTGTASYASAIEVILENGGAVLATGVFGDVQIPAAGTITSWTLLADQTGSVVLDLWVDDYASFPPTVADTITASAKPTLSSVTKNTSSTLTGWTTALAAGDVIRINVDSASAVTRLTLVLGVTIS